MWQRPTMFALACSFASVVSAQDAIPVIRARSRVVTITDGLHIKKDYWYVVPVKSPDVYYVEIPRQAHTVTFTTDLEALSFPVTYGSRHHFVIRLDDGTEALTEVRADYRRLPTYGRVSPAPGARPATIPFTLGDNDKIYVKGRLNGGPPLDFQLDLGAGGSIIKESSVPRAHMTFDGTITLRNSDGENVVRASSRNRLRIADLAWEDLGFAVADNMTHREDGLIGNSLFQDRVLEIDYTRMVLTAHDTLPPLSPDWRREEMILDGVVPFVRGTLVVGRSERSGWFMLDTGAYTSILNSDRLSTTGKVADELRRLLGLGRSRQSPVLSFGGRTFSETNYSVRQYDGDPTALGLMGNDILKRFDLIVDNRQGAVYLRPSRRMEDTFRNPERTLVRVLLVVTAIGGVAVVWRARR